MTPGATAAQAAADFLEQHGRAFGGSGELQFRELWSTPANEGRFTIFAYRQQIRGKDVDGSVIRVKVKTHHGVPRVDYAAGRVAGEPTQGSERPLVPVQIAADFVRMQPGYGTLTIVGEPELVVLRGERERPDSWCWRMTARSGESALALHRTFYVDTMLPRVLRVRNDFQHMNPPTTGIVQAPGMPAAYPWIPYQGDPGDLVMQRIPGIRVEGATISANGHVFSNSVGEFSLNFGQAQEEITVESTLEDQAEWYRVFVEQATTPTEWLSDSLEATVGDTVTLGLENGDISEEFRVAQTDTVVAANRARTFFQQYISTTVSGLSFPVQLIPNVSGGGFVCNGGALFVPSPDRWVMVWARANSGNCYNHGSHSMVGHEYGHVALGMLGIPIGDQAGFHEGYGDTFAGMLNDDAVLGRQHRIVNGNPVPVRDDPTSSGINCQYPLGSTPLLCNCGQEHLAGQLLSGPWVRIREGFKTYYGAGTGLSNVRTLFGDWSLVTAGGGEDCIYSSAHPGTLVEVLSVTPDDSLAVLSIICGAFASHSITCDCGCP